MLNSPVILLASLLFGLGLSYLIAARWPHRTSLTALIVTGITLIIWFLLGRQLPLVPPISEEPVDAIVFSWQWSGGESTWLLSGALLLLLFSLLLYRTGQANHSSPPEDQLNWQLRLSTWQPLLILALAAAGLSVIWAATVTTFMTFWTLFVVLWALYFLTAGERLPAVTQHMYWMLVPLLFAGLAAALKPPGSDLLQMGTWSQPAGIAILLTAMSQMGLIPFAGWRPRSQTLQPVDGALLHLLPSLLGGGLLLRLAATGSVAPAALLILTVFALISLLSGARRAWTDLRAPVYFPAGVALSLSGLAFLIGIWAGETPILAGVHLLVFAATILFLLESHPISRIFWWRTAGPMLVLIALAAFPFTAGFVALSALYTTWFDNSFWILAFVLVLLMLPLLAAVLIFVRGHVSRQPVATHRRPSAPVEIAQLLPAAGLIMLGGLAWNNIHWGTWLALLITTTGALLLAHFVGEAQEAISSVNAALSSENLSFTKSAPVLGRIVEQVQFSLGEAAYILEGDRGLLWLCAFLAILLFAVSS